jgi:DsbC/DsbD-like thiol-disulfide interchange protein
MIDIELPDGIKLVETKFPIPHIMQSGDLTDYGFEKEIHVVHEFEVDPDYKGGDAEINMKAGLLVCSNKCVPAEVSASLKLKFKESISGMMPDWEIAERIESVMEDFPLKYETPASAKKTDEGLKLEIKLPKNITHNYYFFPFEGGVFSNDQLQRQETKGENLVIYLNKSQYFTGYPETLRGILYSSEPWDMGTMVYGLDIEMPIVE